MNELIKKNQNLKNAFIVGLFIIILILFVVIFYYNQVDNRNDDIISNIEETKQIIIPNAFSEVIKFNIPLDWNAAYNGDSTYIADLENFGDKHFIVASVSVPEKPVTYTDINWEQVDFMITDGDLLMENIDESEPVTLPNFTGYIINNFDDSMPVSKGNPDGLVYLLKPNINSPEWNVIVVKQGKGSDSFEDGINVILDSLSFQDYQEYIDTLNK